MVNRRFTSLQPGGHTCGLLTLLDLIKETVHLVRARWTYLLMLMPTFLLVSLLDNGLNDYMFYTRPGTGTTNSDEAQLACVDNILQPWVSAALGQNLSESQQEEFYKSSQLNCSMFKTPVEIWGEYVFENGSLAFRRTRNFALAPHPVVSPPTYIIVRLLCSIWIFWALVAVGWGLQVASTTTPSYNTRPIYTAPQKVSVTDLIQEPFSGGLLRGVLRVSLTKILVLTLMKGTSMFGAMVLSASFEVFAEFSAERHVMNEPVARSAITNPDWSLAHPLLLLFLLSAPVAALEPGMWGFKALWRGVQLMRGNLWISVLVHIMLSLWHWLFMYLITTARLKLADVMNESFWGLLLRWMSVGSLSAAADLPGLFLVPVFYFFCKSCREKAATMA